MPTTPLMTWVGEQRTWTKRYMGRRYYVSCRQLGIKPETKEASIQAANQWWRDKQADIDHAEKLGRQQAARTPLPGEDVASALLGSKEDFPAALTAFLRSLVSSQPAVEPMVADLPAMVDEERAALVLKQALGDLLLRSIVDGEPLPPSLANYLPPARAAQVDRAVKEIRGEQPATPDRTVKAMVEEWTAGRRVQTTIGALSVGRLKVAKSHLAHFAAFLGETADVSTVNAESMEGFYHFCLSKLAEKQWATATAKQTFVVAKQWIGWLAERGTIPLPTNFRRRWLFGHIVKKIETWTADEVRSAIDEATGVLKLALLLMVNTGCTQQDISDLQDDEVNWRDGRIIRKRSKTRNREDTPTVNYKLWPSTFALLKKHRSGQERVLLTRFGRAYVRDGRVDLIHRLYQALQKKTGFKKPLKLLRKTSASLLESHETYGRFTSLFLGHAPASMKDKHYAAPPQALFDAAVIWLGEQLGVAE